MAGKLRRGADKDRPRYPDIPVPQPVSRTGRGNHSTGRRAPCGDCRLQAGGAGALYDERTHVHVVVGLEGVQMAITFQEIRYDCMRVYGIGMEANPEEVYSPRYKDWDTTRVKRMVIVLSGEPRQDIMD